MNNARNHSRSPPNLLLPPTQLDPTRPNPNGSPALSLATESRLIESRSNYDRFYLLTRSDDDTAKKTASDSVATAFARYDLPVPGGP